MSVTGEYITDMWSEHSSNHHVCVTQSDQTRFLTFPGWNEVLGSLEAVLLHPARSLHVQAVVQRTGAQLPTRLEVPARNLQLVQQRWRITHRTNQWRNTSLQTRDTPDEPQLTSVIIYSLTCRPKPVLKG